MYGIFSNIYPIYIPNVGIPHMEPMGNDENCIVGNSTLRQILQIGQGNVVCD